MNQEKKYHLYQHEDGDVYVAATMEDAKKVWEEDNEEGCKLEEWVEIPDDEVLADEDGVTQTAGEHAKDYQDTHEGPGCFGWFD